MPSRPTSDRHRPQDFVPAACLRRARTQFSAVADRNQLDLFGAPTPETRPQPPAGQASRGKPPLGPVAPTPEQLAQARELPPLVRLGTSSWSFPGWEGVVYDRAATEHELSKAGLLAYAQHPLLRTVGIDRTFYAPVPARVLAEYAAQVPDSFRFLVKAHDEVCTLRFGDHPRLGIRRGQDSPHFLDPAYTIDQIVLPFMEGLGEKGGPLLFQFPPQDALKSLGPDRFAARLHDFLRQLPKGPLYAVELRNRELLGPQLAAALRDVNASLCYAAWSQLPPVDQQARRVPLEPMPALVIRWQLPRGATYEAQRAEWAPFRHLQEEDLETRSAIAQLMKTALAKGKATYVIVNNKAEGCAPESVFKLIEKYLSIR
ncbi:MAG: DUF72 domain-containing protein [Deltaproteobacteria bacterium]|nr:DUF72 domain-containing protein [Deltaproteobacteria bacterium]